MIGRILRWIGVGVGVIVVILVIACVAIYAASNRKLTRVYDTPAPALSIASDSATLARGEHLAVAIAKCTECHGPDLGGQVMIPDAKFALVVAPNLTRSPSGVGGSYSDAAMARAIRHGVRHDGTPLLIMPSASYWGFNDADVAAIVAWVRSRPPVDHTLPATKPGPISRVLFALGKLPIIDAEVIDHSAQAPPTPPAGPTKVYGEYLVGVGGCTGCHGPGFSGGHIPGTPPEWRTAANITPAATRTWTEADFFKVLREGKSPRGVQLDTLMPYRYTRFMTDDEIRAVWAYLQTVPPKEFGQR